MRKIVIPQEIYQPGVGEYGCFTNYHSGRQVEWHRCREMFHATSYNRSVFFFIPQRSPDNVKKFIALAETVIGLKENQRCVFRETNRKTIVALNPGPFWGRRRQQQVLTLLLRASTYCNKTLTLKTFWAACDREKYLNLTWPAFQRFMSGYTEIVKPGYFNGWLNEFCEGSEENIEKYLVKPTDT